MQSKYGYFPVLGMLQSSVTVCNNSDPTVRPIALYFFTTTIDLLVIVANDELSAARPCSSRSVDSLE